MLSEYHRNSIITGLLDAFCLSCENYLKTEEDIKSHIEKPVHKKKLQVTPYFDKFKDDYIRKVKNGYYCEFCNLLFSTAANVNLHINENDHKYSKGAQLLKRDSNGISAFENVFINDKAWNGLIDNTCVICNTEFENESIHRTEQTHVLNLIQSNLKFGGNNSLYRKIDESAFQCITCNVVLALNTLSAHLEHPDHEVTYQKCKNVKETNNASTTDVTKEDIKNESPKEANNKEQTAVMTKDETQLDQVKKNKNETINKKKTIKVQPKDYLSIDKRICDVMNAKNYVIQEEAAGRFVCILCECQVDSKDIPRHDQSKHHLIMLKMHKNRLKNMTKGIIQENKSDDKQSSSVNENKNKIFNSMTEFQNNDVKINIESGTSVCEKCNKNLDFEYDAIKSHIQDHRNLCTNKESMCADSTSESEKKVRNNTTLFTEPVKMKQKDDLKDKPASIAGSVSSCDDEDIMNFAKQHNLRYTGKKMYCEICQLQIPAAFKNMKEHVDEPIHLRKLEKVNKAAEVEHVEKVEDKPKLTKIMVQEYINSIAQLETLFINDIVINNKICINIISFLMITIKDDKHIYCELCRVQLASLEAVDDHKRTLKHLIEMGGTMVITSVDNGFVREGRPGLFHCGYCNIFENCWKNMEEHLDSNLHTDNKNTAAWRLEQYKNLLNHYEYQDINSSDDDYVALDM